MILIKDSQRCPALSRVTCTARSLLLTVETEFLFPTSVMFLKHPVPGQTPGKKQKAKKRKAPEELRESDRDYEKKRTRKFQPQWRDRWNWLGYDEEKKEVYFAMPTFSDK